MTDEKESTSEDADIHALQKQWDEVLCPICMDHPHNAVVLTCSSYEKGCRTYICDTSYRHSNCLDRFRKLKMNSSDNPSSSSSTFIENVDAERPHISSPYTLDSASFPGAPRMRPDLVEPHDSYGINDRISAGLVEYSENTEDRQALDRYLASQVEENVSFDESGGVNAPEDNCLKCPLCRGAVLGWRIVNEVRQYMDQKLRSCSRESCSFSGNYKELRKHARRVHPTTRPAEVDPSRQRAWRRLEHQQEYSDILSAIRSAMPGAIVLGDYVVDDDRDSLSGDGSGPWWPTLFLLHMISGPIGSLDDRRRSSRAWRTRRRSSTRRYLWGENLLGPQDDDDWNWDNGILIPRRRRRITRSRQDEEPRP